MKSVRSNKKFYEILFGNSKLTLLWMIALIAVAMLFINQNFFSVGNFVNILRSAAVYGILACGLTVVMVSGEFDMSFGSTVAFSTIMIAKMGEVFEAAGASVATGAIVGTVLAFVGAAIFGLINALFCIKFKLPSFFVTIAMQFVIYGIAGIVSGGFLVKGLPDWWGVLGKESLGVVPYSVILFLVLLAVMYVIMDHTKYGRTLYAIGGNAESARLSGIKTGKYKVSAFVIMQLAAALAGLVFSSQLMGGSVQYGKGMEFTVMISVVIGGASMAGGGGSVFGTFMGLIFMQFILNAMTIGNVGEYPQSAVKGALLVGAILLGNLQNSISMKQKLREANEMMMSSKKK